MATTISVMIIVCCQAISGASALHRCTQSLIVVGCSLLVIQNYLVTGLMPARNLPMQADSALIQKKQLFFLPRPGPEEMSIWVFTI